MKKKIDYLGHNVEFRTHESFIKEMRELSKDYLSIPIENKWIYRVNGGEWKDGGETLEDFTKFLYTHKTPESLIQSYGN